MYFDYLKKTKLKIKSFLLQDGSMTLETVAGAEITRARNSKANNIKKWKANHLLKFSSIIFQEAQQKVTKSQIVFGKVRRNGAWGLVHKVQLHSRIKRLL